jgi:hypothetical protein
MRWQKIPAKGRPFNVGHQGAVQNPATLALAHLLLDSEALNRAAGPCVFTDCVAKHIQAIDALWD